MSDAQSYEDAIDDPQDGDDELVGRVRYTISSYGADLTVDGVVGRLDREDIFVPPLQRRLVWTLSQASRFVESLLLGLPVPGVFLFKEPDTKRLMVVDGQQRLRTLQGFRHGTFDDRPFKLQGVAQEFAGQTYRDLSDHDRRMLDDSIIHATIFQQDDPGEGNSSVYSVFERLNTGGTSLSSQEIRSCIYRGRLNDLLSELAQDEHWRSLFRASGKRKKDEELILRFLALHFSIDAYQPPMKGFLNEFMERNKDIDDDEVKKFRTTFLRAAKIADQVLTAKALRPERNLNVSVVDAVLVGLAYRLETDSVVRDHSALRSAHRALLNRLQAEDLYTRGTTHKDRVRKRIEYARRSYQHVE